MLKYLFPETKAQQHVRERAQQIMNTPQSEKKTPNPKGNHTYTEEDWINFTVIQEETTPIELKTYRISPNQKDHQNTKGIVIFFHQLNDHINNSAHVAQKIVADTGMTAVGFDFRGFGKSEGIQGYLENEDIHLGDCIKFIELVEQYYQGKKIFLSGVSMGGMTAFMLAIRFPERFHGLIMFAPSIKDQKENAKIGKQLAKFIGYWFPKMKTIKRSGGLTNKNPAIGEEQANDPYIYQGKVIPGTIRNLLNMMDKCSTQYPLLKTRFLLVQGGTDKLVCPDLAQQLMDQAPVKDKELIFYQDLWHDIWMEDEIFEIIPKVSTWLNKKLQLQK